MLLPISKVISLALAREPLRIPFCTFIWLYVQFRLSHRSFKRSLVKSFTVVFTFRPVARFRVSKSIRENLKTTNLYRPNWYIYSLV